MKIQCACDRPGLITNTYNPYFTYLRKVIQFPQTYHNIVNQWGFTALYILFLVFIFSLIWGYISDKKE